ncbi:MAG: response regulator transcription factor [Chitinophagaceae bacterium]|nr:response regulator transcription factor [Oligoflexus sp.]
MRRILKSLLQSYRCQYFKTLENFNSKWKKALKKPVLLLADLSLPDGSFMSWMEINGTFKDVTTKCIVISGQQDIGDMRGCLDLGVLDYIVKPFVPAEVQIKVERVFQELRLPWALNPTAHSVSLDLNGTTLTSKQFQIFSLLHSAYPQGVTRIEIQTLVSQNTKVNEKNLTVHLSLL